MTNREDEFCFDRGPTKTIKDLINHIKYCSAFIKNFAESKLLAEEKLIELLGHDVKCSKTYHIDDSSITVKTGSNYILDKAAYALSLNSDKQINPYFPVVKVVTTYEINKKAVRECKANGSETDKALLDTFITESDKKPYVTIAPYKNKDIQS